jgi:hypothetical protein
MLTQHREATDKVSRRKVAHPVLCDSNVNLGELHFSRSRKAQCANRSFI